VTAETAQGLGHPLPDDFVVRLRSAGSMVSRYEVERVVRGGTGRVVR
jgi:hypothetical protein